MSRNKGAGLVAVAEWGNSRLVLFSELQAEARGDKGVHAPVQLTRVQQPGVQICRKEQGVRQGLSECAKDNLLVIDIGAEDSNRSKALPSGGEFAVQLFELCC